ncbi:MAG: hypothetical protein MJ246_08575 [Clostridia bacterium]|nr:hypothetical protein [Clostridia bacterium]
MEFIIILLIIAFVIVVLPILVLYFTGTLKLTEDEENKKDKAVDKVKDAWTICANKTVDAYNIVRPKVQKAYMKAEAKVLKKELDEDKIKEIEDGEREYAKLREKTKIEEQARRDRIKDKTDSKNLKDIYVDFFKTKSMTYKNIVLGFKIATLIIIALGIALAFYISITQKSILSFFITLFVTVAIAFVMYIVAQVIDLLVKIEKNTRKKNFVSNFETYYHKDEKDAKKKDKKEKVKEKEFEDVLEVEKTEEEKKPEQNKPKKKKHKSNKNRSNNEKSKN